jgi:DNA-directed RNA polymerase subunit RPC12/RpoP
MPDAIHRSRMRPSERWRTLLGRCAYRCYQCGTRFWAFRRANVTSSPPHRMHTQADTVAQCPNCSHTIELLLTVAEFRAARQEGRLMSCPMCSAAFVHRS